MKSIKILDCTLRDGGYINDWSFGEKSINFIVDRLKKSKVDYIELGYYTKTREVTSEKSLYDDIEKLNKKLDNKSKYLVMINYSEVDIESIPNAEKVKNIYGIRVCFHKKNRKEAIEYCKLIKDKGYKVFVQPMVTMSYQKEELEQLIEDTNYLKPYAFYVADSFGTMRESDVVKKFNLLDKTLDKSIIIGFHTHNNLQLAYSNALNLIDLNLSRNIILDSSIYGMGRGAGNLNTELIMRYMNEKFNKKYEINFLLEIIDECLSKIKARKDWGYCIEYYLSAIANCHPNYSKYFMDKNTISIFELSNLIKIIAENKKNTFDRKYAEEIYLNYIEKSYDDRNSYIELQKEINNKKVLLVGSGKSVLESKILNKYLNKKNYYVIFVNNILDNVRYDKIFISNKKKYEKIKKADNIIGTSNIPTNNITIVFDYKKNIATELEEKSDNALLIILNILIKCNIKNVSLIGFDGFDYNKENHYDKEYSYHSSKESIKKNNKNISKYIKLYNQKINIRFITKSIYEEDL